MKNYYSNCKIQKIHYNETNNHFSFLLFNNHQKFYLNCIFTNQYYFYLSNQKEITSSQNDFVMYLRKHIINWRIKAVRISSKNVYFMFNDDFSLVFSKKHCLIGFFKNHHQIIKYGKGKIVFDLNDSIEIEQSTEYITDDQFMLNLEIKNEALKSISTTEHLKVKKAIAKLEKKLSIQKAELTALENDQSVRYGELILNNLFLFKNQKHLSTITIFDYEINQEITINLNPQLSLVENANWYFKKGKKRKAIELKKQIIANTHNQLNDLIASSSLAEQYAFIQDHKILPPQHASKQDQVKKLIYRKYLTSNGSVFYVGTNSKNNDYVTFKIGQTDDYWFHIANIPGSHVVLHKNNNDELEKLIEIGAILAAINSSFKQKSKIAVNYAQCKNIKKFNGAKPGQVRLDKYKTVFVENDINLIKNLINEQK